MHVPRAGETGDGRRARDRGMHLLVVFYVFEQICVMMDAGMTTFQVYVYCQVCVGRQLQWRAWRAA